MTFSWLTFEWWKKPYSREWMILLDCIARVWFNWIFIISFRTCQVLSSWFHLTCCYLYVWQRETFSNQNWNSRYRNINSLKVDIWSALFLWLAFTRVNVMVQWWTFFFSGASLDWLFLFSKKRTILSYINVVCSMLLNECCYTLIPLQYELAYTKKILSFY